MGLGDSAIDTINANRPALWPVAEREIHFQQMCIPVQDCASRIDIKSLNLM